MTLIYYTFFYKEISERAFQTFQPLLPTDILDKIASFRRWEDAYSCLFGKMLLKKIINVFGLQYSLHELRYTQYKKPFFESNYFNFNISHSGNCVICIASDSVKVGVDIEEVKPLYISDFENQFHEDEWSEISDSPDSLRAFYEFWTKKEAVIKADGMGLNIPLSIINLKNKPGLLTINGSQWIVREVNIDDSYKCAIAFSDHIDYFYPLYVGF